MNLDDLDEGDGDKENEDGGGDSEDPWSGSDRDYVYDELLQVLDLHLHLFVLTLPALAARVRDHEG